MMPEKFLYLNITNLSKWINRGEKDSFRIKFLLKNDIHQIPDISKDSFILHTAPAINIFDYDAKPIDVNGYQFQYAIYPDAKDRSDFPIYSVNKVHSYEQGTIRSKQYMSVDDLNSSNAHLPCFDITNKLSTSGNGLDYYISILNHDNINTNVDETLSISLECTNGTLPEHLAINEINGASNNSSSLLTFNNITVPTSYKNPPEDKDWMWRLQSMLTLNYLPIANAENLKSLLEFYLFLNKGDHISSNKFQLQISSISDVEVIDCEQMVSGVSIRGYRINIKFNISRFASKGEAFLFGTILDRFFSMYSTLNTFTILALTDSLSGENIVWPARINNQSLN
jgi:type VI secretion system protein ImpG